MVNSSRGELCSELCRGLQAPSRAYNHLKWINEGPIMPMNINDNCIKENDGFELLNIRDLWGLKA